ncbi:MAG TPA: ion channel [Candidatus Methylomirabilis sp.]|nr:ion channel [Candidatus Methylomirabilis sp.]
MRSIEDLHVSAKLMSAKLHLRPDRLLLVSLLLVILLNPVLDHGDWRRLVLSALTFMPVVLSTVRLSQIRVRIGPAVFLMLGVLVFGVASNIFANRVLSGIHWGFLAAFFALTAVRLFSHLQNSRSISRSDLNTAVSIYLLLAYTWAAIYAAMINLYPGSFQLGANATDRQSDLLYFSLVTLTTVGYGDIVPLSGEARMLAALEAVTGVLYVAITVAILVSAYRRGPSDPA